MGREESGLSATEAVEGIWPPLRSLSFEQLFAYAAAVADLPIPELVENHRRSIAMLSPGAPALNREQALEVLGQLEESLRRLRELERDRGS